MMRPVLSKEEYLTLRDSAKQKRLVKAVRQGDEKQKAKLLQMNYSCLPNEDGTLKGSTRMSNTVGMDIDHVPEEEMTPLQERILARKDELGLQMLEKSVRGEGYHLVFTRRPELSQEENLKWASELLGVKYDEGAKDITRVFFTTTADKEDLLFLSPSLFENTEAANNSHRGTEHTEKKTTSIRTNTNLTNNGEQENSCNSCNSCSEKNQSSCSEKEYNGLPYSEIVRKWWEMYNEGKEPVKTNRDVLTFELAVNLRHICGFDRELMDAVIPCYDGFSETQKMKCIDSALSEKRTQMPKRLKDVLFEVRRDRMSEGADMTGSEGLDEAVQ